MVKVSVYYESLCSDSIRFIVQQVYPTFEQLRKFISLDLVPFGKATVSKKITKYTFQEYFFTLRLFELMENGSLIVSMVPRNVTATKFSLVL